ncbi:peptidase M3A and M3B thimet/oligopeptidase F [Hirschia litorea]|uniref:Peptidase M3A and M3B thimet/oligopeptidase F n=1 Tax=Hirschia litorea TaxID=1199156 RepID=A0ABW2INR7_9PROT
MAPDWLKMNRDKSGGWRNHLYQGPVDPKLLRDKKRLQAMVQALVASHLADKSHLFSDLEQAYSLLHRIRLFLHLYLALTDNLKEELEDKSLTILNELNTERVQLQALSIWSVSNATDAPQLWKAAQRRRGVSVMPWRAAVSFAEQAHFASDHHWICQYRYDKALHEMALRHGGLSQMGAGLRDTDAQVRENASRQMNAWLKDMGVEGEELFRLQAKLARKKRFNFAGIDASEKTLEIARRVALERGPRLSKAYYEFKCRTQKVKGEKPVWHDRYVEDENTPHQNMAWRDVKERVLSCISALHNDVGKAANRLISSNNLIQPQGRGGGFTTPVFYNHKRRIEAGPFIYAPFDGSGDSARTLAHELGHGVHAYLSAQLGPMQCDGGWAVAETIALTFEHLCLADDREALADQDFAMLVHQPAIAMFERELGVVDNDIPVDAIWISALRGHYGADVSLQGYEPFWRRHSSTLSMPGYPMAYLLGWALAGYVGQRIEGYEERMKQPLLDVLKAGGNLGFDEAASILGVRDMGELIHGAFDRAHARLEAPTSMQSMQIEPMVKEIKATLPQEDGNEEVRNLSDVRETRTPKRVRRSKIR